MPVTVDFAVGLGRAFSEYAGAGLFVMVSSIPKLLFRTWARAGARGVVGEGGRLFRFGS